MENLKNKILYSALGASGGLAGISSTMAPCIGGACTACLGCAGAGAALVLGVLLSKIRKPAKEDSNAVA